MGPGAADSGESDEMGASRDFLGRRLTQTPYNRVSGIERLF